MAENTELPNNHPTEDEAKAVVESSNSPTPSPTVARKHGKQEEGSEATPTDTPPVLPGELLNFTDPEIIFLDHFLGPQTGKLYITDYKMYFKSSMPGNEEGEEPYILNVPLGVISHVEKIGRSRNKKENAYGLEIFCKDMRTLRFAHKQETHGRRLMYERLQIVAFPSSFGKNVFAFSFKEEFSQNGWEIYDAETELKRLGVGKDDIPWRISSANSEFKLCETYPRVLGVPVATSDEDLRGVAAFRSKSRLPVLSWLHPISHASITRCSQPLVGAPPGKRSPDDEAYLQTIYKANNAKALHIMDARPRINAVGNLTLGGGWEYESNYPNTEFSFLDIGNIHVMREGLRKLQDICFPDVDDQRWFSSLEATHWLDYIKDVLSGAVRVAEVIEKQKASVLVHCSDGWDRTAQLTALAMIMLDPYYRTIRGFQLLVEKEWISFGHKFSQRIGHGDKNSGDDQRAPIFVQFIDCVWQMTVQFPYAFEFNEHFLVTILDHLYSCLFGTFLCNCEKQRAEKGVREKTISLWSFINSQSELYKNPLYSDQIHQQVLFPNPSIRQLQLWKGYYLRWNPRMRPQEGEFERCRQLQVLIKLLQDKCHELTEQTKTNQTPPTVA